MAFARNGFHMGHVMGTKLPIRQPTLGKALTAYSAPLAENAWTLRKVLRHNMITVFSVRIDYMMAPRSRDVCYTADSRTLLRPSPGGNFHRCFTPALLTYIQQTVFTQPASTSTPSRAVTRIFGSVRRNSFADVN